jgi:hypothetical protein
MKYLRRTTSAAANNGMSTTIIPPCSAASFEVNSEPHTGARLSVRLCVGPELARCVHYLANATVSIITDDGEAHVAYEERDEEDLTKKDL